MRTFTSIELCAGGGGTAIGLEQAGFEHLALVENDHHACGTLRLNRPKWNVIEKDLREFSAKKFSGIDLFSAGVPCPPFSKAGKQLGNKDERDLFPEALRVIGETNPKAILIENVRGLLDPIFDNYRSKISAELDRSGYTTIWRLVNASDFGVPQLRPRVALIALKNRYANYFKWPEQPIKAKTVGEVLFAEMSKLGWEGSEEWKKSANKIAPTLVGGSKKHGGPDLGPTRAKRAWAELGVDGLGIADEPPQKGFKGSPRLTVKMAALIQGFPDDWQFFGKKTASYRQIGNAFPPPVARHLAVAIRKSIEAYESKSKSHSKTSRREALIEA